MSHEREGHGGACNLRVVAQQHQLGSLTGFKKTQLLPHSLTLSVNEEILMIDPWRSQGSWSLPYHLPILL